MPTSTSNDIPPPLIPLLSILSSAFLTLSDLFHRIPGSPIIVRYIRSSYQNDPYRSVLEVLLVAFAVRTLLKGRTRGEGGGKNFVKLSEKEIDELVDDFNPQPLVDEPSELDALTLPSMPVIHGPNGSKVKLSQTGKMLLNMATPNWAGLIESEKLKQVAVDTLKTYGVGTCGPSGFYGYIDVHMQLEQDLAQFIGTESAILYAQAFSTVSSVIPAFAKRGDIIVADRGVNFAIQKGIQISRSTVRWFAHGDMKDLERVLISVERELKRKGGRLGRKFIICEGVYENDGMMLELPRVMELKRKYKYRLILDESYSFGMVGKHGRGVTEYYNIPAQDVEIITGSLANGLGSGGGFCAGSSHVVSHQRINSSASVFSASLPAMLATTASASIQILLTQPSLLQTLQTNILAFRKELSKIEPLPLSSTPPSDESPSNSSSTTTASTTNSTNTPQTALIPNKDALISIPSHPSSALIHIFLLTPPPTMEGEERLLQEIVDELINTSSSGVLITRARRLRGQETFEPEPSLKVCISAGFSRKEVEKAGQSLRHAIVKVCSKKR